MNAGTRPGGHPVDGLAVEMRAHRLQQLLQGRREYLKLRQEEVAERLNMSARSYGNWERGVVKEWTDEKLFQLAGALEMTESQVARLFLIAVDRHPPAEARPAGVRERRDPSLEAFLSDYATAMEALSLPSFVIDQRWQVKLANSAYRKLFRGMRNHPTAMPTDNFLRFGLFHPDASAVLVDFDDWRLSILAQFATSLERNDQDPDLDMLLLDLHQHPTLHNAYLNDMQTWVLIGAGSDLVHHHGKPRMIRHPDAHIGLRSCRLIEETPRPLQARGLVRITMVLTELEPLEESAAAAAVGKV
ncbi:helix-turn-helix domain-containing protein [Streptomyces sp. NPDC005389]|uniref:helix-turn-helix domain-containing protein n=1 Tax=Streptomyces sp. NPDC005389 TaxID=3157040 RepID=UPI0033ADB342